jgi:hypothetical protein
VFDFRTEARLDGVFAGRLTARKSNTTNMVAPGDSEGPYTVPITAQVAAV